MSGFAERLKTRIPSWPQFLRRAASDRRRIAYDLLPVLTLNQREAVSRNLARFRPKTRDFRPSARAQALHAELAADGITRMQEPLAAPVLDALVGYFKTVLCNDPYRPHLGRFKWDEVPSDEVNIGYFTWEEVIQAPHMLELVNNPDILAVAELYLGCKPTLDNIGCYWSFGGRNTAKGVQRFHRDFDCTKSVKAFFYLTDITAANGPHVYVRGSHRSHMLGVGKAQTDATIEEAFGGESITPVTGPAGAWFLEDVYGFHKGALPQEGARLLLAIEYNLFRSPLAPSRPVLARDPRYDRYVNRVFVEA